MEKFVKGDVVVIPFPFSDLSQAKRRPALVITPLEGNDLILCQITSKLIRDSYAISLENVDFEEGMLNQASNVRPNRIFTADRQIILYRVGKLKQTKFKIIVDALINIIRG
ncbi:MAG: type II toxin-antitoxin system PemK/MazF family toxin [Chlamydiae bacterium]|nr:type II toxin-antitoxin system PemK/MazF family toxin [Chlamydiota bacterium]MBI3265684.1 type II toxin-antitoxin system PemK/MazF family toxin [Chlamydiota bacterium]